MNSNLSIFELSDSLQRAAAELLTDITHQRQNVNDFWREIDLNRQNFELPY